MINQGGSRSGKTYSVLQYLIELAHEFKDGGILITVCRKTSTALKATAERDFFEIIRSEGLYNEKNHSKSERTYNLFGNTFEFIGLDDSQKVRGRKRDVLFINEANEVDYETFVQLNLRTTTKVIIDYNPSEEFWSEDLKLRDDAAFFITTYKDNPFLPEAQINEIEGLKDKNKSLYQVYALGLFAEIEGLVYTNRREVSKFPDDARNVAYGLDFGFSNDVTALVKCGIWGGEVYAKDVIYETGLTNLDLNERFKSIGLSKTDLIIADPGGGGAMNIEELRRMGWNIVAAKKGQGSVMYGIGVLQSAGRLNLCGAGIVKEGKSYAFKKDSSGKTLNEPIDKWNHSLDALRYWATEHLETPTPFKGRSYSM